MPKLRSRKLYTIVPPCFATKIPPHSGRRSPYQLTLYSEYTLYDRAVNDALSFIIALKMARRDTDERKLCYDPEEVTQSLHDGYKFFFVCSTAAASVPTLMRDHPPYTLRYVDGRIWDFLNLQLTELKDLVIQSTTDRK